MKTTSSNVVKISDKALVNDLASKVFSASRKRRPIIIAFFYYILKFLLSVGAFISRAFLRSKLGERTYGVITIIFIYIFLSFVQITFQVVPILNDNLESLKPELEKLGVDNFDRTGLYDLLGIYLLVTTQENRPDNLSRISVMGTFLLYRDAVINYEGLEDGLSFFWILLLLLSLMHFFELLRRRIQGKIIHSYQRGKSIFFSFLVGKKIGRFKINEVHIWMMIEPLFILAIGNIINVVFGLAPLSLVLSISGICLFFEEVRVYLDNRSLELDIIDSLIDGKKLARLQENYEEKIVLQDNTSQIGPNTFETAVIN